MDGLTVVVDICRSSHVRSIEPHSGGATNLETRSTCKRLNQVLFLMMFMAFALFAGMTADGKAVKEREFQNPILFADYSDLKRW